MTDSHVETISAITLVTTDMARSTAFYEALGFDTVFGGPDSDFTSLASGACFVNVTTRGAHGAPNFWGRVIFYVSDVDGLYRRAVAAGYTPEFSPRDATWGERFFHLVDPDGHELSFARPLGT